MKRLGCILALFAFVKFSELHAQNCDAFFPLKKGSSTEMLEYDGNKALTGKYVSTVKDRKDDGVNVTAAVHNDHYDASGKPGGSFDFTVKCDGKTLFLDMSSFGNIMEKHKGMEDMDVKIEGGFMEVPVGLGVGDALKDAVMTMHMSQKGHEIGTITMTFRRKVEAEESVTVPAGTFTCFRVAVEMDGAMTMMGMKQPTGKTKMTNWFSQGTGPVKSESYNKDGKLTGYSVLNKITK